MKNQFRKICAVSVIVLFIAVSFYTSQADARRGCCSWHGGVCSYRCSDSVNVGYRCCDGSSLSAKCAPYYSSCPPIKPVVIPKITLPKNDIPVKEFKQDEEKAEKEELEIWSPKNEPSVLGKSQTVEIQKGNETEEGSLENTDDSLIAILIFIIVAGGFGYWFFKK